MVVKGLPDQYKSFIAVTTQSEDLIQNFQKFKQALKNFEDTEQTRNQYLTGNNKDNIMKTDSREHSNQNSKLICYNCGTAGHKSTQCNKPKQNPSKNSQWCSYHKTNTHSDDTCRQQKKHSTNQFDR